MSELLTIWSHELDALHARTRSLEVAIETIINDYRLHPESLEMLRKVLLKSTPPKGFDNV